MKRKLRYNRVILVFLVFITIVGIFIYMYTQRKQDHEYVGDVETYNAIYNEVDKFYAFDLHSFEKDDIRYISLNDIYNIVKILDEQVQVSVDKQSHTMTYDLKEKSYLIDYGHDKIVYNNKCIEFKNKDEHIYVYQKNIYISVFLTEKLLFNNEKKMIFENKTAIIQQN